MIYPSVMRELFIRCLLPSILAVVLVNGCSDGTNAQADDLPSDGRLVSGDLTATEFAEAIHIVGEGDVSGDTMRAATGGLIFYLDDVAEAATSQSTGDFSRVDIVEFVTEVGGNEAAVDELADVIAAWASERAEPLVADPHYTVNDIDGAFRPVAMVIAACMDGLDASSDSSYGGGEFSASITGPLHDEIALAIAADRGRDVPEGPSNSEIDEIYQDETDYGGNPVRQLDLYIGEESESYSDPEGDHWQQ